MPNKCGVVNCKGNYDQSNKCRVFKLPRDDLEKLKWLNTLPPRENFIIDPSKFFICEKHWPPDAQMIKLPGGSTKPAEPPSIFGVPSSLSKNNITKTQHPIKLEQRGTNLLMGLEFGADPTIVDCSNLQSGTTGVGKPSQNISHTSSEGCADSGIDVSCRSHPLNDEATFPDNSSTATEAVQREEDDNCESLSGKENCDSQADDTNAERNNLWKPNLTPAKESTSKFKDLYCQVAQSVHLSQHLCQYQFKCGICCKQFANMNDYSAHKVVHRIRKQNRNICEICGASFRLRKKLLQHKKLHATDKFTCNICLRQYLTKVGRDKHMAMHRGQAYGCTDCDLVFTTLKAVQLHKKKCQNQDRFKCEICDKQFNSKFKRDRHVSMHRGKDFGCDLCEGVFKTVESLKEHRKEFHQDFMFPCSGCTRKFLFAKERDEHMNLHIGVRPFECSLCNKACFSQFGLYAHTMLMHNDKQTALTCKICNIKFKSISARNTHYHRHSSEDLIKHKIILDTRICEICGFVTRRKYLKQHMISEHSTSENTTKSVRAKTMFTHRCMRVRKDQKEPTGPHRCEVCQKVYKTLAILKRHMISHSTSFQCNMCGKGFCSKSNLEIHVNIHTGAQSFKCSECCKQFGTKSNLAHHMKYHRNEIVCKTCGTYFTHGSNLNRHIKAVHERIKDFKCEFCEKVFSTKYSRDIHMNIHTGAKPYVCDRCGARFSDKRTLSKHVKRHKENYVNVAWQKEFLHYITKH